jgi:hypothetical protein
MIALSLITLLAGLFCLFISAKLISSESNFWGMVFFSLVAIITLTGHGNIPTKYGISYSPPDAIIKTNGTTVVLYDNYKQTFTSTDTKWYLASNETMRVEWRSNTNLWGRAIGSNSTLVLK